MYPSVEQCTNAQKHTRLQLAHTFLSQYEEWGDEFSQSIVTNNESILFYLTKQTSIDAICHRIDVYETGKSKNHFFSRNNYGFILLEYAECSTHHFPNGIAHYHRLVLPKFREESSKNSHLKYEEKSPFCLFFTG